MFNEINKLNIIVDNKNKNSQNNKNNKNNTDISDENHSKEGQSQSDTCTIAHKNNNYKTTYYYIPKNKCELVSVILLVCILVINQKKQVLKVWLKLCRI